MGAVFDLALHRPTWRGMYFWILSGLLGLFPIQGCKTSQPVPQEESSRLDGLGRSIAALPKPPKILAGKALDEFRLNIRESLKSTLKTEVISSPRAQFQKVLSSSVLKAGGLPRTQLEEVLRDIVKTESLACGGVSCEKVFGFDVSEVDSVLNDAFELARKSSELARPENQMVRDTLVRSFQSYKNHMTLLYWDNMNLGFGHVALMVYGPQGKVGGIKYYMSYAMGNKLKIDMMKHGKTPKIMDLPGVGTEKFDDFTEWYLKSPYSNTKSSKYGEDYCLVQHNCANAVVHALKAFGYDIPIDRTLAVRPNEVRKAVESFIAKNSGN